MSRFLDSHKVRCLIAPSSKNSFEQYCKVLISLARLSRSSLSPERLVRSFRGTKGTGAPKRGTCPQACFFRIIDPVNSQRRHFCLQIERVLAIVKSGKRAPWHRVGNERACSQTLAKTPWHGMAAISALWQRSWQTCLVAPLVEDVLCSTGDGKRAL